MKRLSLMIGALAAAAAATGAAAATAAPGGAARATGAAADAAGGAQPRAQVRDLQCVRALDPPARAISITAVMRPLPGTQRLEMKVELLTRSAGIGEFTVVPPPPSSALGVWISPTSPPTLGQRPGDIWQVKFPVADLAAPATYRYRASFRWIGARNRVLGTATRLSGRCHQPELRPDLVVRMVTVLPLAGHPRLARYRVVIGNAGQTAAGSFAVRFSDAGTVRTVTVAGIGAHSSRRLRFTGPACSAADPPTVTLDPQGQIDDADPANNVATVSCA